MTCYLVVCGIEMGVMCVAILHGHFLTTLNGMMEEKNDLDFIMLIIPKIIHVILKPL